MINKLYKTYIYNTRDNLPRPDIYDKCSCLLFNQTSVNYIADFLIRHLVYIYILYKSESVSENSEEADRDI